MLAIAADFAGSYGSYRGARENSHVYAAGPQFSFSNHTRVTPLVYAEAGDSRSSRAGSVSNAFFFEVGGGANIKLANRISLQIIPAEYDFSHPGAARNSYTARAGLVFALTQK
jgi:hypothetical protein